MRIVARKKFVLRLSLEVLKSGPLLQIYSVTATVSYFVSLVISVKEAAYGLLWKEEAELQRALNASIQAKRHKEMPTLTSTERSPSSQSIGMG